MGIFSGCAGNWGHSENLFMNSSRWKVFPVNKASSRLSSVPLTCSGSSRQNQQGWLYGSKGMSKQKGCHNTGQVPCSHPPVRPHCSGSETKITSVYKLGRAVCRPLLHLHSQLSCIWLCLKFSSSFYSLSPDFISSSPSLFSPPLSFLAPSSLLSPLVSEFLLDILIFTFSSLHSPPQHTPEHRSRPAVSSRATDVDQHM